MPEVEPTFLGLDPGGEEDAGHEGAGLGLDQLVRDASAVRRESIANVKATSRSGTDTQKAPSVRRPDRVEPGLGVELDQTFGRLHDRLGIADIGVKTLVARRRVLLRQAEAADDTGHIHFPDRPGVEIPGVGIRDERSRHRRCGHRCRSGRLRRRRYDGRHQRRRLLRRCGKRCAEHPGGRHGQGRCTSRQCRPQDSFHWFLPPHPSRCH